MPTIKDVAKLAGVSVSTASVALSGKGPVSRSTQTRVLEAARSLQYRPNAVARSLVTRRSRTIGLVLADLTDPYFHGVAKGVEGAVSEAGYTVVLADTDRSVQKEERSIETLLRYQVDGLILAGSGDRADERLAHLCDADLPVVAVGSYGIDLPCVTVDNERAAAAVTEHLLSEGYVRIGYVGGPEGLRVSDERWEGVRETLERHGLKPAFVATGDFTPQGGYEALRKAWRFTAGDGRRGKGIADAVVAANDQMAIGVIKGVKEMGARVPDDVGVAGIGDISTSTFVDPPLTTVSLPLKEMGRRAAHVLLALIEGRPQETRRVVLDATLKVRASTQRSPMD